MNEHWLIIGASSAIARAFARLVAERGAAVTVAGRDIEDLEAIAADNRLRGAKSTRAIYCDLASSESRTTCIANALIPGTTLNILVAAGYMPEQDAMDADPGLLTQMINATYTGPVAILQGLAPELERQRGGKVVVIGSVAGDRGRRKNYLYGSAKAALGTYTDGLRARLFVSGTTVTLVKPGFIDTAMTWGLPKLFLVSSPENCAKAILSAAENNLSHLYHPFFWRYIMLIIKNLPNFIMKRLNF